MRSLGKVQDGEATYVRLALAECLVASGNDIAAKKVLEEAIERLRAQIANIDNPIWKESFVSRIHENKCIVQLATRFGIAQFDQLVSSNIKP